MESAENTDLVRRLPRDLMHAKGYRENCVTFARTSSTDRMVTSLAVDNVPVALREICVSSAELALLSAMLSFGYSVEHVTSSRLNLFREAAADFAAAFLAELVVPEKTVVYFRDEVRDWLLHGSRQHVIRALRTPPGEEWA